MHNHGCANFMAVGKSVRGLCCKSFTATSTANLASGLKQLGEHAEIHLLSTVTPGIKCDLWGQSALSMGPMLVTVSC